MSYLQRVHRFLRQFASWFGGQEPMLLLAILLVLAGVWGFIELADEVMEGDTEAFDRWAVKAMRQQDDPSVPIGPPWLQEMGRDATALGGVAWLTFCTIVVAGYQWIERQRRMMLFLLVSILGGLLVSSGLKQLFNRPRPDVVPHLSHVFTTSFPSGHSLLSAVVYLTLGSLLAASVSQRRLKLYFLTVALLLTFFVGLSRIYLGVHYPTDVLAGWMAGLVWALMCWLVAHWLQRLGRVEHPPDESQPTYTS